MRAISFVLRLWFGFVVAAVAGAALARRLLQPVEDPQADQLSVVSIFDRSEIRSTSSTFRGGSIWTMFGATELDLRRAEIDDRAHLEVTTLFGGVEITVPDSWSVVVQGPSIAGGVNTEVPDPATVGPSAPRLTVASRTCFGGVNIVARPVLRAAGSS